MYDENSNCKRPHICRQWAAGPGSDNGVAIARANGHKCGHAVRTSAIDSNGIKKQTQQNSIAKGVARSERARYKRSIEEDK